MCTDTRTAWSRLVFLCLPSSLLSYVTAWRLVPIPNPDDGEVRTVRRDIQFMDIDSGRRWKESRGIRALLGRGRRPSRGHAGTLTRSTEGELNGVRGELLVSFFFSLYLCILIVLFVLCILMYFVLQCNVM